jgi:diaminobutyrate-2-oxoglutarate transaminase
MAVVLIKPEYDLWQPAEHNGTFRGNTHAFVTAHIALKKFWSNQEFNHAIVNKTALVTRHLQRISKLIPNSYLKGRGMMQGICVDAGSGKLADKITRLAFEKRLIIETSDPYDEVIKVLAPLTTPDEQLEKGLTLLENATAEIMAQAFTPSSQAVYTEIVSKESPPPIPSTATVLNEKTNRSH